MGKIVKYIQGAENGRLSAKIKHESVWGIDHSAVHNINEKYMDNL